MIFIAKHVKMVVNRRGTNDTIQTDDEDETFFSHVTRVVQSSQIKKQPVVDVVVALISIPLLVVFSLMLQSNMRSDWLHDADTRWRILGLGLSLLFVSLVVCLYVTHRMGLCIWAAQQQQQEVPRAADRRRISHRGHPVPLTSTGSQLHLMVSGELPPSYDAVMRTHDMPPSYTAIFICDEKKASDVITARSTDVPGIHRTPAPPPSAATG